MTGIRILGTGSYAPPLTADNHAFTRFLDTSDEWIRTRTGISNRHISNGEPTWFMGLSAAREALEAAGVAPAQVGLILDATVTPDFVTPATACVIQRELGAVNAMAFDVNSACTGFLCIFDMAVRYLATDPALEYVLVIANENLTKIVNYEDRASCILFGDGAAACVVTRDEAAAYASFFSADGTGGEFLCARSFPPANAFSDGGSVVPDGLPTQDHYLLQDGRAVYRFATAAMPHAVECALERAGLQLSDIDWLIPHQANLRIIETAVKKLAFPMERVVVNLDRYGNTSSASVPIALNEAIRDGRIQRGQRICLVGFGAGLTMGAAVLQY